MRQEIGLFILGVIPGLAADTGRPLPLFFVPNSGQTDSSIRFVAEAPELRAAFGPDSVTYRVRDQEIRVRFSNANQKTVIEGVGLMLGKANFLIGNHPNEWRTNVPTYEEIVYHDLYPGIDMTYGGDGGRIKSEFLVAPGADPARIRLDYNGAAQLIIDSDGALVVKSPPMELRELAPEVYQEFDGVRVAIEGHFRLISPHTIGFELGPYDRAKPLVIDPVVSYCTYLGGAGIGSVTGVAVDSSGNLYVTGWTEAHNFPIAGAPQSMNQGGVDAFVLKLNAAGTSVIYATYVGGRADDRGAGIAVDSSGQAYVTGYTTSTNFPVVAALRSTLGGARNAFALKLNPAGSAFVYSTYLGGSNYDMGNAIAVDAAGSAYIAGDTYSTDFPVLHPAQASLGGLADAFVTKLTSAGAITFSTFLGGSNNEHAGGIAVDSGGNVYVAGGTFSSNFPTAGAIQAALAGGENGFVTKISAVGSTLVYSTYLGGNGGSPATPEQVNAIAVDAAGNAYVAGVTNSTNFPVTLGVLQPAYDGSQDAFAAKINPAGSALVYSTYLGGSSFDWANGIAADSSGNAYVGGYTLSADFPIAGGIQLALAGLYDAFISKLNPSGSALLYSTYYGGTRSDTANGLAIDSSGNIFVGGQTSSYDLPLQAAIETANSGGATGWVMRVGFVVPPPQAVSVAPATGSGSSQTFTFVFSDQSGAADLNLVQALISTSVSTVSACNVSVDPVHGTVSLANDAGTAFSPAISLGVSGSAQNSQCTVNALSSSLSPSGNTLTLNLAVSFLSAFNGAKNTYGFAQSAGGQNSGWTKLGTFTASVTVASQPPQVVSVTPNAATGATQTFSFVFTDSLGAADINTIFVGFGTSIWAVGSCFLQLYPNHTVALANDATVTWMTPITLGASTTTQNSQCTLNGALSSVGLSGNTFTLTLGLTFQAVFDGTKNIYASALSAEGLNSTWLQLGTYTVSTSGVPVTAPVLSPPPGTYSSAQSVGITTSTSGASIRYTTDGSTPTETVGTLYSAPFTVSASETIKAIGYETGMTDSAVVSAVYTINTAAPGTAQFVKFDTATQGSWEGVYGADGYNVINNAISYPGYVTPTVSGNSSYTWPATSDVRALQQANSNLRIAAVWYAANSFTIDLPFSGSQVHQLAVYCLDFDEVGRAQRLDIVDTQNNVLDSRSLASMNGGVWVVWSLSGHVQLRLTETAGPNAVVNGLFFDTAGVRVTVSPQSVTLSASQSQSFLATVTNSSNTSVTWSINQAVGSITSAGLYTAPPTITAAQAVTITATSQANGTSVGTATVNLSPPASAATAQFVKFDTATLGSWKGVYGADGYNVINNAISYPGYVTPTVSGNSSFTWPATTDVRALQQANSSSRIAAVWYAANSFTIDLPFTGSQVHQLAVYCLDFDNLGRAQRLDIVDTQSNVLDSRSLASMTGGVWVVWSLSGHVQLRLTETAGPNAVINGLFFDTAGVPPIGVTVSPQSVTLTASQSQSFLATVTNSANTSVTWSINQAVGSITSTGLYTAPVAITAAQAVTITATSQANGTSVGAATVNLSPPGAATAQFVKFDTATQGSWEGVYGADGYNVINNAISYPGYVTPSVSGSSSYTWPATTDVRALQQANSSSRIAAVWYAANSFTIDLPFTGSQVHQLAVYCLDFDNLGRAQRLDIVDTQSNVLDSRSLASMTGGVWVVWSLSGHVRLRLTETAGPNAVINGLFFDTAGVPPIGVTVSPQSVTLTASQSQSFLATVTNSANTSVTWSINQAVGSITSTGLYTAPVAITAAQAVTITATSQANGTSVGAATVNLSPPGAATAQFVKFDTATQGSWEGVYGADGYNVINNAISYPGYVTPSVSGSSSYTWPATTDVRALQQANSSSRIAAVWYAANSFTIDLPFSGSQVHQLAVYCLDFDNQGRAQRMDIVDGQNNVLDTRSLASTGGGVWVVWNLSGHVQLRVTRTAGPNATLNGLFFGL